MIDFRYFLVTIVAIFFALAVGIVLGSGPLETTINGAIQGQTNQLVTQKRALQDTIAQLNSQQASQDNFTKAIEPAVVSGLLAGQSVTLLVLPGASADDVRASNDVVVEAGASVGGTITVTDAWSDPAQRDVLTQLTASLAPASEHLPSDPYEAAATVLSSALVDKVDHGTNRLSPTDAGIVAGYQEAKFVTLGGDNPSDIRRGTVAVIVAPPVDPGRGRHRAGRPGRDVAAVRGRAAPVEPGRGRRRSHQLRAAGGLPERRARLDTVGRSVHRRPAARRRSDGSSWCWPCRSSSTAGPATTARGRAPTPWCRRSPLRRPDRQNTVTPATP